MEGCIGTVTALVFTAVFTTISQSRTVFADYWKSNQSSFLQKRYLLVIIYIINSLSVLTTLFSPLRKYCRLIVYDGEGESECEKIFIPRFLANEIWWRNTCFFFCLFFCKELFLASYWLINLQHPAYFPSLSVICDYQQARQIYFKQTLLLFIS